MNTSNLTFRISKTNFITITDSVVSAEYVNTNYINNGSMMDQQWINGGSMIG